MSNRQARRAAKGYSKSQDVEPIPLRQPDTTSPPAAKTLYEIAAEKQPEYFKNQEGIAPDIITFDGKDNGKTVKNSISDSESSSFAYVLTCLLYSTSLTMVHFTFDVLVHQQYRQEIGWDLIAWKTLTAFPVLSLLLYLFHGRASVWYMQLIFTIAGAVAGCYIVHASNTYSYFAVMQKAPPVGTLWIWCVFELEAIWAAVSVILVGTFFVWGGYTFR